MRWCFRGWKRIIDFMEDAGLSVRIARGGSNYTWELHRAGIAQKVKYSAPIYITEESAMAAGCHARELYLARLERKKAAVPRRQARA
jgi:hypothetical protein